MTTQRIIPFCFILSIVLLSGCGAKNTRIKTEMVEGVITLDGVPLSKATITFHPQSGSEVASGFSKEDGTFVVTSQNGATGKGAVAGEYTVTVEKSEIIFSTQDSPTGGAPSATYGPQLLPAHYLDKVKTPLKAEIKPGKNRVLLELSSK